MHLQGGRRLAEGTTQEPDRRRPAHPEFGHHAHGRHPEFEIATVYSTVSPGDGLAVFIHDVHGNGARARAEEPNHSEEPGDAESQEQTELLLPLHGRDCT